MVEGPECNANSLAKIRWGISAIGCDLPRGRGMFDDGPRGTRAPVAAMGQVGPSSVDHGDQSILVSGTDMHATTYPYIVV